MDLSPTNVQIAIVAFLAALVNGAVGYGFSSIVTPIALFWTTNRLLNPSLVVVELFVNVVLLVRERKFIRATNARAMPVIHGLLPGVIVGSIGLVVISATNVRMLVYALILPLTVLQLLGYRRPLVREKNMGALLGSGLGVLYALTTISGPPLALFWRNQGLSKEEFRCAMAQIRTAEAGFTTVTYLLLGLFTPASVALVPFLLIPVLIGVPLGTLMLVAVSKDLFSRVVMAVDGIIVSYGLGSVLQKQGYLTPFENDVFVVAVVLAILLLAVRTIRRLPALLASTERKLEAAAEAASGPVSPGAEAATGPPA